MSGDIQTTCVRANRSLEEDLHVHQTPVSGHREEPNHPLSQKWAVHPQVAGVEHALAVGLDQERETVERGVIHWEGGDGEVTDLHWLAMPQRALAFARNRFLPGEDTRRQEHLARALTQVDRHVARRVREQARMVRVRVGEEDGVHLWPRREQPRNGRRDSLGQRLADAQPGPWFGRILQVIQRQTRVDDEARVFGGEFHARAANLFRTAMDDEFH